MSDSTAVLERITITIEKFLRNGSGDPCSRAICGVMPPSAASATARSSISLPAALRFLPAFRQSDVEKVWESTRAPRRSGGAEQDFSNGRTEFRASTSKRWRKIRYAGQPGAIEHFEDRSLIPRLADRCRIDNPSSPIRTSQSTLFNPYHVHDFSIQEIVDLLPDYICYHSLPSWTCSSCSSPGSRKAPTHMYSEHRHALKEVVESQPSRRRPRKPLCAA